MARARSEGEMEERQEDSSVEKTIEKAKGIDPGPPGGPSGVQSVTKETPNPEDETPMPNVLGTDPESPPVHTARPDVPIAQTLAAGAGEHTPPDPKEFAPSGRPRDIEES